MRFQIRGRNPALALACFVAVGCAASAQMPKTPSVFLTISFPVSVTIHPQPANAGGQITPATAQLTLTNTSSAAISLQKPNGCQAHVWTVSDASGKAVDDRAICPMIFIPVHQRVAANGTFTSTETVSLANAKYRDGGNYMLHYTFWGIKADAPFTVRVVP